MAESKVNYNGWKFYNSVTGTAVGTLPENFKELYFIVSDFSYSVLVFRFYALNSNLNPGDTFIQYMNGYSPTSIGGKNTCAILQVSDYQYQLVEAFINDANRTNYVRIDCYYK